MAVLIDSTPTPVPALCGELAQIVADYEDTVEHNGALYRAFETGANAIGPVRAHRDFVDANNHGYGDRAFHYMWKLLVDQMPSTFRFLEIGVYKGQIISLIRLLADLSERTPEIFGVTPLSTAGDRFSVHDDCDYLAAIDRIHRELGLSTESLTLIHGFSQAPEALDHAENAAPYDILYVDGCHEPEVVVHDLTLYPPMLRLGGFLVVDDCGRLTNLPDGLFQGFDVVSVAAQQLIDTDPSFRPLLSCGHNRVWQRIR